MTVSELLTDCSLFIATKEKLASCEPFVCKEEDLNDFFAHDAISYHERLLGKTYIFCSNTSPSVIIAAFTLSNDSIRLTNRIGDDDRGVFLDNAGLNSKKLKRYPSVLIGRFGINKDYEHQGYGSAVMDFIKMWFLSDNKTGCRFIIVDAYNNDKTIGFYKKNKFEFLIADPEKEARYMEIGKGRLPLKTRHMFFDLLQVKTG